MEDQWVCASCNVELLLTNTVEDEGGNGELWVGE